MLNWIVAHWGLGVSILLAVVSEIIAIRQQLKYPDNDGFGGVLAAILKVLQALGAKPQA